MIFRILAVFLCIFVAGSVAADQISIHTMVVDKKALELSENRQITFSPEGVVTATISPDGKRVAYVSSKQNTISVCIAKSNGANAIAALSSIIYDRSAKDRPAEGESWLFRRQIVWSPDSKHIAIPADKISWNQNTYIEQGYVIVLASNGAHEMTLAPPDPYATISNPSFSPDSGKIAVEAMVCQTEPSHDSHQEAAVLVYDISQSSWQVASTQFDVTISFDKWTDGGQSLRFVTSGKGQRKLNEFRFDDLSCKVIQEIYGYGTISPNESYKIPSDKKNLSVVNLLTNKSNVINKVTGWDFIAWATNSRMLMFKQQDKVTNKADGRTRALNTLWLANVESTQMNTMCIALDYDGKIPTMSTDCTKIAYMCNGRLYIAELNWRELNVKEKVAAGIATEEEEKALLLASAKEIGIGLQMRANDWNGEYPDEAKVIETVSSYLRDSDLFCKPGTDEIIFKYIPPGVKINEIENPVDTIIGEMDLGRSWKVVLYADTHVRVVDK